MKTTELQPYQVLESLRTIGIDYPAAQSLRRIAMTLHHWHELECGDCNDRASWGIERAESRYVCTQCGHKGYGEQAKICNCEKCGDPAPVRTIEQDGKPYRVTHHHRGPFSNTPQRVAIADKEKGAIQRLEKLMAGFPNLIHYIQSDPRGASLYILKKSDVNGDRLDSVYTRGIAVY